VPGDRHVVSAELAPPRLKLLARNVKRSRRDQVIEHDRVLLAPAKRRERGEIIVVEEILSKRRTAAVEWSINQLRGQEQTCRRHLRQVQQGAPVDARRDLLAHGFTNRTIHSLFSAP
jgi:hypothetical protein